MEQRKRLTAMKWFLCLVFALIIPVESGPIFAADNKDPDRIGTSSIRYRVFSLRKISAEQARQILTDACIGTVSKLPGANTLLVTGSNHQLISAATILRLTDVDDVFAVEKLCDASEAADLPSNERLARKMGNPDIIGIGTFIEGPADDSKIKAIIDVCEDKVIVIAPKNHISRIVQTAAELKKKPTGPQIEDIIKEKPETVTEGKEIPQDITNEDELFNKLIQPLGQAESLAEQQKLMEKKTEEQLPAAEQVPTEELPKQTEVEQPRFVGVEPEPGEIDIEAETPIRSYKPEPVETADEMLELNLPEKLNIIDLVDLVGKYLNLDYMYDPKEVTGDVSLKLQGPMKIKDLYPLLESVLKFRGFVMSRSDNLVTVVKSDKALDIDPALLHDNQGRVQYGDVIVTRVFELQYLSTQSAQNLLGQLKLGVNITPIAETGTLIVTGYTQRMSRIEQILRVVDKPGVPREFRYRQLKYTMAKNLVSKVDKLADELGTVSVTVAAPTPEQPPAARTTRRARQPQRPTPAAAEAGKPSVYLDVDERTNRILMIGQTEQLDVVERLIDALDVEKQDLRTLRLYDIQYVGAEEVKKKLEELGIIGTSAEERAVPSRRTRAEAASQARTAEPERPEAAPRTTRAARSSGESEEIAPLTEEPQVIIIESTNSLLVNASAEQHAQIALIIGYVDSETVEQAIPYEIYQLENQKPDDVAAVLQKLIEETVKDKEGKVERVIKREEDIVIVPDENTFSLIVYASRKNQEWIKKLINVLDKRRPQVLIDVTLVQIAKTDQFEYDLDLLSSIPDLTDTSGLTKALMGDSNSTNLVSRLVNSKRNRFIDFQTGGGAGLGFYGDVHINALLTAMQTKNYGRVLAKPKILVNDNEEGVIKTTDTTYVEKKSSTPLGTTGEAGQQTTLVTTAIDYQGYDAGITLNITPHISDSDLLRLEIKLTRSDFGTITGLKPPDITSSDIDTVVTVPDGSTIILGGLLKLNQGKGGSKIPLLGDIPLIGGLFRSVSNSDIQRKLYIFVKAEVIRPEDAKLGMASLVNISNRNRKAFEEYEDQFQKLQDWPGFDPQPIDPVKVLEAE
jgi:type II secretory pathway component GspD/PulD (secretin)